MSNKNSVFPILIMRAKSILLFVAGALVATGLFGVWYNPRGHRPLVGDLPVLVGTVQGMPNQYWMGEKDQKLMTTVELNEDQSVDSMSLCVPAQPETHVSVDCVRDSAGNPEFDTLTFSKKDLMLVDYGFDGVYDLRFERNVNGMKKPSAVYFLGEWRNVDLEGEKMMFDAPPYGRLEFVKWSKGRIRTNPEVQQPPSSAGQKH